MVVPRMSTTSIKVAIALFMVLTPPAASFARGGHGGGHAGLAMRGFARPAGSGAMGNVPISGIARDPGNAGGLDNLAVEPSGGRHAFSITPAPHPNVTRPTIP